MKNIKNEGLTPLSRTLRKNMTREERHLWYDFLKNQPTVFKRQKVIGNYIVDFFCAQAGLVIERDGSQHYSPEGKEQDAMRDKYLKSKGLMILRYSNLEVERNFQGVCTDIRKHLVSLEAFPRTGEGGASAPDEGVP